MLGDLDGDGNLDAFTADGDVSFRTFLNGDWTQAEPPPMPLAANLVQCPDDPDSFYMVGGILTGNITSNRLYRYDIDDGKGEGEWVRLADLPGSAPGSGGSLLPGQNICCRWAELRHRKNDVCI